MKNKSDPNPIVDSGFPRSSSRVQAAAALCTALGIDFKLRELDCEPFLNGGGHNCSDTEIAVGI